MFAPDYHSTTINLTNSLVAVEGLTVFANAMSNVVDKQLHHSPNAFSFAPVHTALALVVSHGKFWSEDLCDDLTNTLFETIISFNDQFEKIAISTQVLQKKIDMSPNGASGRQQQKAIKLMTDLQREISQIKVKIDMFDVRLTDFLDNMEKTCLALSEVTSVVEGLGPDVAVLAKQVKHQLGDDFLDIYVNGPSRVAVSLKSNVAQQIMQASGAHPELIPYLITLRLLPLAEQQHKNAARIFSQAFNIWSYMASQVNAILIDLQNGAARDVNMILTEVDFAHDRSVWRDLAQTAEQLWQPPFPKKQQAFL